MKRPCSAELQEAWKPVWLLRSSLWSGWVVSSSVRQIPFRHHTRAKLSFPAMPITCTLCCCSPLPFTFLLCTNQDPWGQFAVGNSGLSGQIAWMSDTQWYLWCHKNTNRKTQLSPWLGEVQNTLTNQTKANVPVNAFAVIKTSKKGRRELTRWNSYTLCWVTVLSEIAHF